MSISVGMDEEDVVHVCSGILLSHKKEYNWVIHRDVNGPVSVIEREVSQEEKTK